MICNLTKKKAISHHTFYALSFWQRGRGMIGRNFDNFDAMVFNQCNSIHTMFMSQKIDVLFVDIENKVCALRKSLLPWRPFIRYPKAVTVIELPEGNIERTGTELGDVLDLNAELSDNQTKIEEKLLHSVETVVPLTESKR
jgi:uncharacterized membrane protein (UPF0127 family)